MRYYVGKGLELVGLVFVTYALYVGIVLRLERPYILFVGGGIAVFTIGWLLERKERG